MFKLMDFLYWVQLVYPKNRQAKIYVESKKGKTAESIRPKIVMSTYTLKAGDCFKTLTLLKCSKLKV